VLLLLSVIAPLALFKKHFAFGALFEHSRWRLLFAFFSFIFLGRALYGTIHYLGDLIWKGGSYWVFVIALTVYVTCTLVQDIAYWYPGQKQAVHFARWAIVITLSVFSVLSFAYRVYPYIPADKGGGNYHFSRDATICMLPKGLLPPTLQSRVLSDSDNTSCSDVLKILEITDTTVYAALSSDQGENEDGQIPKDDNREAADIWNDGVYFPTIYAISRNKIAFIQYEQPRKQ
jgi:hypothetical protein